MKKIGKKCFCFLTLAMLMGCSGTPEYQISVEEEILFEPVNTDQEDIYALVINIADDKIQTNFEYATYQVDVAEIYGAFDAAVGSFSLAALELDQDYCEYFANQFEGERITICDYVPYTVEGDIEASSTDMVITFFDEEGNEITSYSKKILEDVILVE